MLSGGFDSRYDSVYSNFIKVARRFQTLTLYADIDIPPIITNDAQPARFKNTDRHLTIVSGGFIFMNIRMTRRLQTIPNHTIGTDIDTPTDIKQNEE